MKELLVKIALAQEPLVPCGNPGQSPCETSEQFYELIIRVINFMIHWLAFPLVVLFFLWGGFLLLTSGGSTTRIEQGKKAITGAIIGLVIVLTSVVVINTVLVELVDPEVCTIETGKNVNKAISVGRLDCPGLFQKVQE